MKRQMSKVKTAFDLTFDLSLFTAQKSSERTSE